MHNGAIMPSEVAHLVDTGEAYPVVRLAGVLDADAAQRVQSALLAVLAEQPEAVVVDVSDLRLADPAAGGILREVAQDNADWPGAHIVLCARRDPELWHSTGLPVWPDLGDALAELGAPETDQRLRLAMEPFMGTARRARELVTEACVRWDCPELAGAGCIVVTEMVNNVITHARTEMVVLLGHHGDTMSVAVRDHSATVPRFHGRPASPTSYGGRGLLLIDSVSNRWGHFGLADGKVVWAVVQDDKETLEPAHRHIPTTGMADPARG
jgi:anti-anti-sigma regulatory factor